MRRLRTIAADPRIAFLLTVSAVALVALLLAGSSGVAACLQEVEEPPAQDDGTTNPQPPAAPTLEDLKKRLFDADPAVRDLAAGDLVRDPEASAFIRETLRGAPDPTREPAVISLLKAIRVLAATAYIPEVLDLCVRSGGNGTREAARATIQEMRGNAEARDSLLRIFRESTDDAERRRKAVEFLEDYRCLRCISAFIEVATAATPPAPIVREAIVHALETITGEEYGNDWGKWIEWRNRVLAPGPAGEVDWTRVQAYVSETFRNKMTRLRERVIELTIKNLDQMKAHDPAGYKQELLQLVAGGAYPEIRADAATRLGNMGDPGEQGPSVFLASDVEALLQALRDADSRVVAATVWSLGKIGAVNREGDEAWGKVRGRVREAILPLLRSEFADVRRSAVEAAGRVGGPLLADALRQMLEELIAGPWKERQTRESVIRALGEPGCASPEAIPVLAKVLAEDPEPPNRERAADSLGRIRADSAIAPLRSALENDSVIAVRWAAVRSLVRIGGDQALAALTERLEDPTEEIRQRCASALGDLGRPEAADALIDLLRREEQPKTRVAVIESLGKLRSPKAIDPLLEWLEKGGAPVSRAAEEALRAIWDDDPDLLVRGGQKLVAIAGRKKELTPFAVATLERAEELVRSKEPGDLMRVRAKLSLASAYLLDGKVPQSEAMYRTLYPMRAELGKETASEIEIGLNRCVAASGRPFEAFEALRGAARNDYDPGAPPYWRIAAAGAELLVEAAEKSPEGAIDRTDAYTKAQGLLTLNERPANLPADLVERLDRLAVKIQERLRELAASPERAEEERIKDVILRLGSEVTQEDPEKLDAALREIMTIPLEKSVPCVIGYLEDKLAPNRKHALELLRGLFPGETIQFDPDGEETAREQAVAAIRDWWAKHPRNPAGGGERAEAGGE